MAKQRVLILGAGFGGLELATRLSERAAQHVDVTLLDRRDSFVLGFSKLAVMLGERTGEQVRLHYRDFRKPGVRLRQETVTAIDPQARRVTTDHGVYAPDFLVVAMGADYDFDATPGFREGGFSYYSVADAERLHQELTRFDAGRVVLAVLGQPFKCPPAPFEGAFLLDDHFTRRGVRGAVEITCAFPMQAPVPVNDTVSGAFNAALSQRHIRVLAAHRVVAIDPAAKTVRFADGDTLAYDLFIGVPVHRAPDPLPDSGLLTDGWVHVEQTNLRTRFDRVYAIGDVCTGARPVPKAGIFAEAAAQVVADDIQARITGGPPPGPYTGAGLCYVEFGAGAVGKVEVNALGGPRLEAESRLPSASYASEKEQFAAARRSRWFGR